MNIEEHKFHNINWKAINEFQKSHISTQEEGNLFWIIFNSFTIDFHKFVEEFNKYVSEVIKR